MHTARCAAAITFACLLVALLSGAAAPDAMAQATTSDAATKQQKSAPAKTTTADKAKADPRDTKSLEDDPLPKGMFADKEAKSGSGSKEKAKDSGNGGDGAVGRMLFGLVFVLGLIYAVHWLLKKYGSSKTGLSAIGAAGVIDVLATTPLAADRALHLVRVGDEVVLIGATSQSVTHLRTLTGESSGANATAAAVGGQDFQQVFHGAVAAQGTGAASSAAFASTGYSPSVLAAMSGGTAQPVTTSDSFLRRFFANLQLITAR